MVGLEPQVKDYERFTATEAAKILDIHYTTLARYEKEGVINPGRKGRKYKMYYGKDIKKCWKNCQQL